MVKDSFYKAKKNLKGKTSRDLGITRVAERNIYISESLTVRNKVLFNQCLSLKRDLKYSYIWTYFGRIFLRKDSDSPAIMISCKQDIDSLRDG